MSDTEQDPLTSRLAYLAGTMDDDDRPTLSDMLKTARAYLAPHIAGYTLAQPLLDDVVLGISLDLWQAKDARNGIVGLTVDGVVGRATWTEVYDQFRSIQSDNGTPNAYPG